MPKKKNDEAVPAEIVDDSHAEVSKEKGNDGRIFLGLLFVLFGVGLIIEELFPGIHLWQNFWPVILIVVGIMLIFRSVR